MCFVFLLFHILEWELGIKKYARLVICGRSMTVHGKIKPAAIEEAGVKDGRHRKRALVKVIYVKKFQFF